MPLDPWLTVVVPTRNRSALAIAAVKSVLSEGVSATVILSDNSTNDHDHEALAEFCSSQNPESLQLLRPAESLSMSGHWQWAMASAMQLTGSTHYTVLTDRMVFKSGHLREALRHVARHPSDVLTYNYDKVEDASSPVHVELEPWSGQLLELGAAHLLRLSARGVYSNALPRMLNTIVPRPLLGTLEQRFGSVFASISPDVCFAYRCLAMVDRLLYFDKAVLLQYAVGRSQGLNYARGIRAPEVVDFAAMLGSEKPNFSCAPIPSLQTVGNAMFHEYAFVRAEAGSARFPEIDRWNYLGAMAWNSRDLQDQQWAAEVNQTLKTEGWTRWDSIRWVLQRAVPAVWHEPGRLLRPIRNRLSPRFTNAQEAFDYANHRRRRKSLSLAHHWQLRPKPLEAPSRRRKGPAEALIPE